MSFLTDEEGWPVGELWQIRASYGVTHINLTSEYRFTSLEFPHMMLKWNFADRYIWPKGNICSFQYPWIYLVFLALNFDWAKSLGDGIEKCWTGLTRLSHHFPSYVNLLQLFFWLWALQRLFLVFLSPERAEHCQYHFAWLTDIWLEIWNRLSNFLETCWVFFNYTSVTVRQSGP